MSFNFQYLQRMTSTINPYKASNPPEGQVTGQAPTVWTYNASSAGSNESTTTVTAANYFVGASGFLAVGDWIIVDTNNPAYLILNVTAVTAGTTVTVAEFSPVALPSTVMQTNQVNTMVTGGSIVLLKANGTEASNAVTANGQSGVITTSSLTTAGGSSYAITWTNSSIASTSVINLTIMGGTNTTENVTLKATAGVGVSTLTIYNNTAATALNGTILIGYSVW